MKGWRLIYVGVAAMFALFLVSEFGGSEGPGRGSGLVLASVDAPRAEDGIAPAADAATTSVENGFGHLALFMGVALFVLLVAPVGLFSMFTNQRPLRRLGSNDEPYHGANHLDWNGISAYAYEAR